MKAAERVVRVVSREQARLYMVGQLKVKSNVFSSGGDGVEEILKDLRCIQVDSLDPMGLSHELVVMARTDGVDRGTMFRHLPDGSYFEHWAKERCILPASAFPYYHNNAQKKHMTHWWYRRGQEAKLAKLLVANITHESSSDDDSDGSDAAAAATADEKRLQRAMKKVIKEVKEKGPQIHPGHLTPINNERHVLWGECRVVITRAKGRDSKVKLYSTPDAIFAPEVVAQLGQPLTDDEFARWAVLDRVEAAGLLPRTSGPHWSVFEKFRKAPIIDTLLDAGDIEEVQIEGSRTVYLAPKGWLDRQFPDFDDRMRLIAPLDPLVWHRPLVQHVFGFEYVWEVYKKEATRTWGWYVCPLLYKGRFVGRLEGKVEGDDLVIKNVWKEETPKKKLKKNTKKKKKTMKADDGEEEEEEDEDEAEDEEVEEEEFNEEAFRAMLKRHAEACGASRVVVNGRKMTDGVPLVYSSLGGSGSGKSKTPQKTKKTTKPEKKKAKKAVTPTKRKRAGKAKLDEDEDEEEEEEASFDDEDEDEEDGEVELKRQKQGGGERRKSTRTTAVKRKKVATMEDEEEEEEEDSGSDANDPSYGQ